jgi:serine/threonine protein kinase/WD40 repeat protein
MPGPGCVSELSLRAFLLGELPERVGRWVASHLESCAECEAAARRLDGLTDTLIERLRREFEPASTQWETGEGHEPVVVHPPPQADGLPESLSGYELLEVVGRGGMSVVYRARQRHPSRVVALKVLLAGAERRARLIAEADALARLGHPNVVRIYEVGEHGGLPFLALEYVEGGTLADRLGGAPLPPREAAALAERLARAVHAAHRAGVVHRDLKPANVLLDADGTPKVTDFGLAKQEESDLTATGAVLGTPSYLAPEQAEGRAREVGPAADVHALGAILYEMLTGRPPFRGATPLETLDQVRTREPVAPGQLRPKLARDLDTVCLACLRKDPAARYATAEALADDLGRFLRDEPIRARRTGPVGVTWRWCRRNPAVAALIGAVAALLVALAAGSLSTAWRFRAIADAARREATERLFDSKVTEARAKRLSGTVGQRFESLRLLSEAAGIVRQQEWPRSRLDPLRNEAIAALTRFDLRDVRRFGTFTVGGRQWYRLSSDLSTESWDVDASTFTVRRTADGREVARIECPGSGGRADNLLSGDGRYLAVWARTEPGLARLRLWDLSRPGSAPTVDLKEGIEDSKEGVEIPCWSFSADSRRFAYGSTGGSVSVCDPSTGREVQGFLLKRKPDAAAFHPVRPWLAVSAEHAVEVHDLVLGGPPVVLPQPAPARRVSWHPAKDWLAVAVDDFKIHIWDVAARKEILTLAGLRNGGIVAEFNHSGDLLVTREWNWTTRVWDMRTGRQILQAPEDYGTNFSPDDQALAAHQRGEGLGLGLSEVADRRTFRELVRDPSDGPSTYRDCAFSPTLPVLAAAMGDGFGFWDVRTGNQVARQVWPRGSAGVWFERSGALLVHGHGRLTRWPARGVAPGVWRFGPPEPLAPPVTSSRGAGDFAASLDGSVVVRGDLPAATLWRRDRPGAPVALSPHRDVRQVEVSPDGRWVTTMGYGTDHVRVWDAGTGRLVREFSEATGPPGSAPTADGSPPMTAG